MSHLTYAEAGIVGLIQGVTELFPISSLGHSILIPALVGGQWAQDLNVSAPNSPYLAFIVGLHVATAIAMIIFFRRDWARIIAAFFASVGHVLRPEPGTRRWEPQNTDQMLAWMIILATIPVAIAGAAAAAPVHPRVQQAGAHLVLPVRERAYPAGRRADAAARRPDRGRADRRGHGGGQGAAAGRRRRRRARRRRVAVQAGAAQAGAGRAAAAGTRPGRARPGSRRRISRWKRTGG